MEWCTDNRSYHTRTMFHITLKSTFSVQRFCKKKSKYCTQWFHTGHTALPSLCSSLYWCGLLLLFHTLCSTLPRSLRYSVVTLCYTLWENILLHTEEGSCVTKVKCNQKFGKIYRECFRAIGNPEYPNNRQLTSDGLTHGMANPMDTRFTISLLVKPWPTCTCGRMGSWQWEGIFVSYFSCWRFERSYKTEKNYCRFERKKLFNIWHL